MRNSSEDYYTDSTHAAALALDSGNAPHVVYVDTDTIRYLHRTTAGWQRETVLAEVSSSIDVAFGPDGNLNFVANDRRSSVFAYVIFVRDSAGTWSEQEIYSYRDTGSGADVVSMDRLVFGPDGRPYVQARAGGGISAGSGTCTGNRLVLYSRSGSAWSSTLVDVGLHGGASNIGQTVFMAGDLYVPHYNDSVDFPYPGYGVPQCLFAHAWIERTGGTSWLLYQRSPAVPVDPQPRRSRGFERSALPPHDIAHSTGIGRRSFPSSADHNNPDLRAIAVGRERQRRRIRYDGLLLRAEPFPRIELGTYGLRNLNESVVHQ
ncbi:MAG: hypothetical protein IPK60_18615 [Sandaracinaceae bacterium]|nr:hypothetical protein [Sandaracinaceae bacterium]